MSITEFMERHYLHFNAREVLAAARAYRDHIEAGGRMLVAMGGAMSTGQLGVALAPMIRAGKVHAISTTGANLEEDLYNLLGRRDYKPVPNYRDLTAEDEVVLRDAGFARVTDVCIPSSVMEHLEHAMLAYWREAAAQGESHFPWEYLYRYIREDLDDQDLHVPREHSWLVAACDAGIPVYTAGWEDSTLGNIFAAKVMTGEVESHSAVRPGTQQMEHLIRWYQETDAQAPIGFFQIAGGIAGDFAICSVPTILQDLKKKCRYWQYFAQISDSVTSYGSYSGAVPNEKITWLKLEPGNPSFMINSDASIVAPLIFAYVLGQ